MYAHIIEQHGSFGMLGGELAMEGFKALEKLAKDMAEFVLANYAHCYAPIPYYEQTFHMVAAGAGIWWYLKEPQKLDDTQPLNAYGQWDVPRTSFEFFAPGTAHSGHYKLHSTNLQQMLLWAEIFTMALERRQAQSGVNVLF
jgi:hypothetical protein